MHHSRLFHPFGFNFLFGVRNIPRSIGIANFNPVNSVFGICNIITNRSWRAAPFHQAHFPQRFTPDALIIIFRISEHLYKLRFHQLIGAFYKVSVCFLRCIHRPKHLSKLPLLIHFRQLKFKLTQVLPLYAG